VHSAVSPAADVQKVGRWSAKRPVRPITARQANQIWIGRLSTDGLRLDKHVHLALGADRSLCWECAKGGSPCVIEGPSAYAEPDGTISLPFSADSTWDASYKVGVAASSDPDHTPVSSPTLSRS
jgi:hypothetical protein